MQSPDQPHDLIGAITFTFSPAQYVTIVKDKDSYILYTTPSFDKAVICLFLNHIIFLAWYFLSVTISNSCLLLRLHHSKLKGTWEEPDME